jgi:hypothetical protein
MAIGIPAPGILPGNPLPGGGFVHGGTLPGALAPPATSPSEAMQWLLATAATLGMNPMELAHMFTTAPEKVAQVLDAAGVPSPTPATGETADVLGAALTPPPGSMVRPATDYATDPTVTPPQPGLSAPMPASPNMIPPGTVAPEDAVPGEPASSGDLSLLPEQQPGVGAPRNAPVQTGTPLSGVTMPANPNVQGIGAPAPPQPDAMTAPDLNKLIQEVLSVARPQAANLTLGQALPQVRR